MHRQRPATLTDEAASGGSPRLARRAGDRRRRHGPYATAPSRGRSAGRRPYSVAVPTLERPLERFDVDALRDTVTTFRDAVTAHAAGINRLNVYPVPDGDTGTNMARTLDAVVAEMEAAAPTTWRRRATRSATAR